MRIAVGSIAVGLAVLIVAFAILGGFRQTIQNKIFSLSGQLQVTRFSLGNQFEELPVSVHSPFYHSARTIVGVRHIQVFSHKPALIKTDDEVQGVVLKGVGRDFNVEAFKPNLIAGQFLSFGDTSAEEVLVSQRIANQLQLAVGNEMLLFFLQDPPRFRRLTVRGIYQTGLEEFDQTFLLGDIRLLRQLNDWPDSLAGGYELFVDDFAKLPEVAARVYEAMDYDLGIEKITDRYPQLFDWLFLLGRNVSIFLVLILIVACFNIVSTLLIMIMERTQMIGLLKALGAHNQQIRTIFMFNGMRLIVRGLLWGNALGIGLCAVQHYFRLVPLDPENYYMSFVPIAWDWPVILQLNALLFVLTTAVLLVPTLIIASIQPIRAIRFD